MSLGTLIDPSVIHDWEKCIKLTQASEVSINMKWAR